MRTKEEKPIIADILNVDELTPIRLYGYTTTIWDRVNEYDDFEHRGDITAKEAYMKLIERCENSIGKHLNDNKVAIECQTPDGRTFYIGQYDNKYSVGTKVHQFFGRIFDFKTNEWSEYRSEEECCGV